MTEQETNKLIILSKNGDIAARNEIVEENIGLVGFVLNKHFGCRSKHRDDLYQTGCLQLIECINRFDVTKNCKFSTFAISNIYFSMAQYLMQNSNSLAISSCTLFKKLMPLRKYLKENNKIITEVNAKDLSIFADITVEEANTMINDYYCYFMEHISLDSFYDNNDDDKDILLIENIKDDKETFLESMQGIDINKCFILVEENFSKRNADIFRMFFTQKISQSKIGVKYNLTQVQISRIIISCIKFLRLKLNII